MKCDTPDIKWLKWKKFNNLVHIGLILEKRGTIYSLGLRGLIHGKL